MNARTQGAHHVGLTVKNAEVARDFFVEALGYRVVGEKPDYPAFFVSDGSIMLTLWQLQVDSCPPFDRKSQLGLHHLALSVPDADALQSLHADFAARDDVEIEFAPEALGGSGAQHFMCAGPSGIRLEFVWWPS